MARTELHLEQVTAQAGAPLASLANATISCRRQAAAPAARRAGRRSRPAGRRDTGEGEERLVRAAVAVELVHSATLVHDDLIDGAQLRRGHPTVAAAAGRGLAIATGDLLFSRAFAELARNRGRRAAARALAGQLGARRGRAPAARGRLRLARAPWSAT